MSAVIYQKIQKAYKKAKKMLDEQHEEFIATYVVMQGENEHIFSMCTWTVGVDTIFPHTDYMSLVNLETGEILNFVPQKKFLEIEGVEFHKYISGDLGVTYYVGKSYPELHIIKEKINRDK